MGRFDDDLHLVAPEDYVPTTVRALLKHTGVRDASIAVQTKVIVSWLKTHKPSPLMELSLRDSGFGDLLNSRVAI